MLSGFGGKEYNYMFYTVVLFLHAARSAEPIESNNSFANQ
jgi:hypothetical protein